MHYAFQDGAGVCGRPSTLCVSCYIFIVFTIFYVFFYGISLLTYDRQKLMDILQSMPKLYWSPVTHTELSNNSFYSPPKFSKPSGYLHWQIFDFTGRRRRRRCEKWVVRLNLALASGFPSHYVEGGYRSDHWIISSVFNLTCRIYTLGRRNVFLSGFDEGRPIVIIYARPIDLLQFNRM